MSPAQLQNISTYIDILLRWNARINLTAIRNPEEIVTRHFGESLFAASHLFPPPHPVPSSVPPGVKDVDVDVDVDFAEARSPKAEARVADLGSGAGFPGIPIKLWAPQIALTLIESNQKKVAFLREVARALTLTNIDIFPGPAQSLTQDSIANHAVGPSNSPPRTFDLVTLRAVERFHKILPTAASLVVPAGRLALLIGAAQVDVVLSSLRAFNWQQPLPLPGSHSRVLLSGLRSQ
ncbi:MAG: 16S rRNA (guanine(527)-N(7))-methyltransferase RsmG [Candidatus Sulfotelmatobacter sp.]